MELSLNGITINYEMIGSGPALVMLHGNGETHEIFLKAAGKLAERFTVYLPDTRGHGKSSEPAEYHYDDFASDLIAFCEALKLQKPIVYGFSDGGITALLAASRHTDMFSAIIVSGANIRPNGIRPFWLKFFTKLSRHVNDPKIELMLREPNIPHSALARITVPAAVFAGGRDLVLRGHTEEIAAAIPGSTLRIFPLDGHGSYVVKSKRIARYITEFCEQNKII